MLFIFSLVVLLAELAYSLPAIQGHSNSIGSRDSQSSREDIIQFPTPEEPIESFSTTPIGVEKLSAQDDTLPSNLISNFELDNEFAVTQNDCDEQDPRNLGLKEEKRATSCPRVQPIVPSTSPTEHLKSPTQEPFQDELIPNPINQPHRLFSKICSPPFDIPMCCPPQSPSAGLLIHCIIIRFASGNFYSISISQTSIGLLKSNDSQ